MKNLKQLVLPCYKLEMVMTVEAWYFLHGSTDGVCNLTFFISLLSKMTVSEVTNAKRGLSYALHPGQADSSMLVLAKEWGIGRKAVARLLEDFSERGLIRVDSNPVTSVINMVCVRSWMIAGRLIENPTHRQTVKTYEGVRIFLFNGQRLETLRRSSPRKRKAKPSGETETADPTTIIATESVFENTAADADDTPVLEDGNALPCSKDWKQA
ncbi:hypothetical protein [Alistipes putredinis]|uniref:hypothetical protein n=1 Tax=Alistipes putredinis TaxID=28117 RepID=UPI003AB71569